MTAARVSGRQLVIVAVVAVILQGVYAWEGHPFVAAQYAAGHDTFLFNLIPAPSPRRLVEYLARADELWRLFQIGWIAIAVLAIAAPALEAPTGRLHAACLRFGRTCAARPRVFLVVGAALVAGGTAAIGWWVLRHFANSGDEYCYLYQADTLLAGRFSNPPPALRAFFETNHIIERNGRLFSVFPPGWPLILAGALRVGLPAWIVNPCLSAGLFIVTFLLARRLTSDAATAVLASIILPLSGFFLVNGASYFSHTACALLVVGAMLAMVRAADGDAWSAALAGLLAGLAVITRYYTPILCLLPLTLVRLRERPWRWQYLAAVAGALPPLAFMLIYNHSLTGSVLTLSKEGVERYDEIWFAPGFWHRGGEFMLAHLWDLALWAPAGLLLAYVVALRRTAIGTRLGAVGAGFACLVLGLYPYINRGGNQYGPRFYFDGFPLLVIAAAAVIFGTTRYDDRPRGGRRLVYAFFATVAAHLAIAGGLLSSIHAQVHERMDLQVQVERAGLSNAIVFVATPIGVERAMPANDFTRNGIDVNGPVLYALDRGDANRELRDFYPTRACFIYRFDPNNRAGSLTPCGSR